MATRTEQNEAYKKAFILNAVPFLMDIYEKTKLGYNNVDVSKTSEKFSVPTNVVPTMVDLRILTMTGEKRTAMYHWKGGTVCNEMAGKIYDRIQLNKNTIKLNKKMVESHTNSLKTKNLVKVIGSSRGLVQDDSAIILRAMYAVHASTGGTNDGQVRTRLMILDIIKKEVNNDTFAERILNGLIDGNYIKSKNKFPNPELNLYSWVEQIPNREHALFIKDMIKETVTDDKPNRIYNFLMSLHKIQSFTEFKLRPEIRKHGLSSNDQFVITNAVLDYVGNNVHRKYRWKLSESPSMKLVEELMKKSHDYGAKYYPGNKAKNANTTNIVPKTNDMEKQKQYGENIQIVLNYIRLNGTATTADVIKLTNSKLSNHAISNVFWRLNKDGLIGKVKSGVYTSLEKTVVPTSTAMVITEIKEIVKEVKPVVPQRKSADLNMEAMISNLKVTRDAMNAAHELSMKEINEKIRDGELILAAREKEKTFMESCSKFVFVTDSYKVKHDKPVEGLVGHNKTALLDIFATKEVITLAELKERFYPGKNTNDAGVKALMAMLYYMRKDGHIKHIDKGEYALIKK